MERPGEQHAAADGAPEGAPDADSRPVAVTLRRGRPLAPMQRALWMSQRRHPDAPVQNMALLSHLDTTGGEPIDAERLADAFAEVVRASDALRTTIVEEQGTALVQLLTDPPRTSIVEVARADAEAWATERAHRPIDTTVCSYDSVVLVHEDATVSWYLALHHTITDATSSAMVFAATATAYAGGEVQLDSYYDWASRLGRATGARAERAARFWRERPAAPGVGRLYRTVRTPTPTATRVPLPVDDELFAAARARLAGDYTMVSDDLAWTTLLVTVAAVHLHRVARVDTFAIGVPVHNRSDARSRALIGPLMEVVPVDVTVEPGDTFRSLHRRIGRSLMQTLRHAVAGTAPAADVEAVVNVIPRAGLGSFGNVPATTRWIHSGATDASHLVRLQLTAYGDHERELLLDINAAAADPEHVARAGEHAVAVLRAVLDDPDRPIGDRSLATADELAEIVAWETADDLEGPTPGVVDQLGSLLPRLDTTVLEDLDLALSGRELWRRVARLAHWLREQGVHRGARVGVELPRSADAVLAILGVLVAGGSYVPLDPA
ncbi:MAG: condensation domain-containing protein, partial [Actinomycetes bacterium]